MTKASVIVGSAALLAALGMTAPAQARPRDTVLAHAYRCAGIGESRAWLDCYYGAAQPVRAALQLGPVPARQLELQANPPLGPATDQSTRDAVMARAAGCGGQARAWLGCYYAAAEPMRALLHLAPAVASGQAVETPPDGNWLFGSRQAMRARMTAYHFDMFGHFTITLDNGQVWRQLPGDTDRPHWNKPANRYAVSISHGALGSTNLTVNGSPGLFRVERVR